VLNRLGHAVAERFLAELPTSPRGTLVRVTEADEEAALQLIARYRDKDFTSFVVMDAWASPMLLPLTTIFGSMG
jgi:hypothetical protein